MHLVPGPVGGWTTAMVAAVAVAAGAQVTVPKSLPPQTRTGGNITADAPVGPLPRKANGQPDLGGVWLRRAGIGNITQLLAPGESLPFLPATLQRMRTLKAQDDPQLQCLPLATPRSAPYPFRIVEAGAHVFILTESTHGFRQIYVDGRTHPPAADLLPSWHGHSIGRWEGDTLVVDTVGFNDLTWFDNYGHLHSDRMRVTERFTRADLGRMNVVITVDDPGAYARPFTLRYTAELIRNGELLEYICENEQDAPFIDAPAGAAVDAEKLLAR
jgi:hypothetical protein